MGRGIIFGAFWGFIVGGIVLAVASLLGDVSTPPAPEAAVIDVPAGSRFDQSGEDRPVSAPREDPPVDAPSVEPLVTDPVAPTAPALDGSVTEPPALPQTGEAGTLAAPPTPADAIGRVPEADVPVDETAVIVPAAPTADLVRPTAPEAGTESFVPPVEEAAEVVEAEEPAPAQAAVLPETFAEDQNEVEPTEAEAQGSAEIAADSLPEATSDAPEAPVAVITTAPTRPTASAGGFGNLATGVVVNRPTSGAEDAADGADAADVALDLSLPPIERFAETADWVGEDGRPLMSIVLIDEAANAAALAALNSFRGPLTFAIPADAPGAPQATAAYRSAGHEVVLLADIPEGLQPADVEVTMAAYLRAVPEAVAVLDGSFQGFRGNRAVAAQVVQILKESGHGLVTFDQGLNAARQIADQAGVPATAIFRDLDAERQGNTVIRRFLDQAAFRAGQDGQVVLLARMRAETISALLIWHQQDRANRVNLAPLSAILTR